MKLDIEALRSAAIKATPQNLDSAHVVRHEGDFMECPTCGGEGYVETGNDYCNFDDAAIGVAFYGIGDAHVAAEAYYRMARPEPILQLIRQRDELLAALKAFVHLVDADVIRARDSDRDYLLTALSAANQAIANAEGRP